jgi:hypothetical protein
MRTFLRILAGIVLLVVLTAPVFAQETTATITGVVRDDTGGVLPGVSVVARHLSTGRTFQFTTTSTGAYTATLLPIGSYELSFTLSGFQPLTVSGIRLAVNDRLEINGMLKVGGVAETVQVTAETQLVQPQPQLQALVSSKEVQELPLNNRNFAALATLAPGVSNDMADEVGIGLTSTMSLSVNGARRNALNWLVDGVSNVDVGSNITLLSTPTLDSIEEFKIITSSYQAEWPRSGGGIVNVVTKSGSNKFTGSGYYYLRNDALNSNTFFRQLSTDPAQRDSPPMLRYGNFGYTLGGPVPVAQVKNKMFFFWSEEWRQITRAPASLLANVPDPTWLTDPTSANYVPPEQRDPNAVKLLAAWPAPNVPGKNQYSVSSPNINNTRQEVIRIDYDFSPNWRLSGRYTHDKSLTEELGGLWYGTAVPNVATTETTVPGQVFAVSAKTIIRSNILNEFSFQRSGNQIGTANPPGTKGMRSDYGITIPEIFPENNTNRIPSVSVSGLSAIGSMQLYTIQYWNNTITDNFSWLKGNHALKFGGLTTFEAKNENAANVTQGSFSFGANGGFTAFQNFLRGNYDGKCTSCSYTEAEKDITMHLRFNRFEFYAQDSWKARRNLTIDAGLRYALYPAVTDVNNQLATFSPAFFNPATAAPYTNATGTLLDYSKGDPLDGMIVAGKNSPYGRAIYATDKNSIQPRLGVSWDPTSKGDTMLRGAFGVYFDQPLIGIFEQDAFTSPPFVNNVSLTGMSLSNPGSGTSSTISGVRTITASATDFKNPRTMQWNITVSKKMFQGAALEVGYVGSRGDNLIRPTYLNYPSPADVVALQATTAGAVTPARPYRSWGNITFRETTAISRYNGLLTSFRWNAGDKGTLTLNYTLSRNRTDATNDRDAADIPQNPADPMAEYADARTDRRHIFTASYVYMLPFFKDSTNTILQTAFGGWQIAGITFANSGQPVPYIQVDTNGYRRGKWANAVGDPKVGKATQPAGWPAALAGYYFDPTAYVAPADGTWGNAGRAMFRQPGFFKTDLTLSKSFYFSGGSRRLQFRADFINAFNQLNWTADPTAGGLDNTCTTSATTCNVASDRFGQLISARYMREIQFGLKLYW